jgi:anti-sigma regulatory factor (Ser/Thr protein kinase)
MRVPRRLTSMPIIRFTLPSVDVPVEVLDREIGLANDARQPVVHLRLGEGKLNLEGVERLLNDRGLSDAFAGKLRNQGAHLIVDLRNCIFADPYGLSVLRALCASVSPQVERMWLCLPEDLQVQSYFGVIGLCNEVREEVTLVGEYQPSRGPSANAEVLLPISRIATDADAVTVSRTLQDRLDRMLLRLQWPEQVAERTLGAIRELTFNVVEHAESPGYVCVQGYRLDRAEGFLVAAISDAGVGMRTTLARRHPSLRSPDVSDGQVLARLFREQLSSRSVGAAGNGMRVLSDAVQTVGGRLEVRSGLGLHRQREGRSTAHTLGVLIPGTHIRLGLNRPSA